MMRYPKSLFVILLALGFFALGFWREQAAEHRRLTTIVESSEKAERDYQDLIFAYQLRLNTIRSLVGLALRRGAAIPTDLVLALDDLNEKNNVRDEHELQVYENEQMALDNATKDLIASLDSELSDRDEKFTSLFRDFNAEEASLLRIKESYTQQTSRVRSLARKGDRKYFAPDVRFPASVEEQM